MAKMTLFHLRLKILLFLFLIMFLVLLIRVWSLQVIHGEMYRNLSESNRLRDIRVPAPRGSIMDDQGHVLAYDSPAFNLSVIREDIADLDRELTLLADILGWSGDDINAMKRKVEDLGFYTSYPLVRNVSFSQVCRIEALYDKLAGFTIKVEPMRRYNASELFCHAIGYMSEISQTELEKLARLGYRMGDYLGVAGLEKSLNLELRGKDGLRTVEVDALGREIKEIHFQKAEKGKNIFLTINKGFQNHALSLLENYAEAAVVVMDLRQGNLLVFLSKPGFDTNRFYPAISRQDWQAWLTDAHKPLQNRTIQGLYSPGSVFKMVVALAGLQEGLIHRNYAVTCSGVIRLHNHPFHCWKAGGHGTIAVRRALAESCNIFFYLLGDRLGVENIHRYATAFGLGGRTGIILANENQGLVPNREWKRKARQEKWYAGETISLAIGQGSLLVTPLQLAVMAGCVATRGKRFKPRLVGRVTDSTGEEVDNVYDPVAVTMAPLPVAEKHFELVSEGLEMVFSSPHGTARLAGIPGRHICGKTGTAQVVRLHKLPEKDIPYHLRHHNLLVSFAERENPEIAVVVLLVHGGKQGAVDRCHITRGLYEYYYNVYKQEK